MPDITENKKKHPGKIPDITVRQALEQADLFALRTFLRKEAPRNKFLSIKLKTSFIESITLDNGHNKFEALLGELIREDQYGIVILTKREIKLLADVCSALLELSSKFFANEALRDNYDLLAVMLIKLHRYLDKVLDKPIELIQKLGNVYDRLTLLLSVDVAPELRDDMFSDGMRLLGRSYYTMHQLERNIVPVLLKSYTVVSQLHAIHKVLEEKIISPNNDDQVWWSTWYSVVAKLADKSPDLVLLHQVLTHREIIRVAKNLHELAYDEAQHDWMNLFDKKISLSKANSIEWDNWRFRSSLRMHDDEGILTSGMRLLLQTESKEVYQEIKSHYPSRKGLITRLRENASPVLLGEILVFEEDWKELEYMIRTELDIEILLIYLAELCGHSNTAFETISLVAKHFASHFAGESCRDGLSSVLFRLDDLGYSDIAKRLNEMIDAEFPGRFAKKDMGLNISS